MRHRFLNLGPRQQHPKISKIWVCALGILLGLAAVAFAGEEPKTSSIFRSRYGDVIRKILPSGEVILTAPPYAENEVLVRFKEVTLQSSMVSAHSRAGANVVRRFDIVKNLHHVRIPRGRSVERTVELYRSNPDVLYAEPNYIVKALAVPNDPFFGPLWGLQNTGQDGGTPGADIDAPAAWDITMGSNSVVVAAIDTGVYYNHADLAANMWRNTADCNGDGIDNDGNGYIDDCYGIDTVNNDSDPKDDNDHGTHVAGIIGAVGNNSVGVVGVNWHVSIMACKFLDAAGSGYTSGAIACLEYVKTMKDRGVNIVATNNSWGGGGFSQALYDAIDAHRQRGILFIAAAGNESEDSDATPVYPASYNLPNVISVAATDRFDNLAFFSNYGRRTVHLGAPGSEILSTTIGNLYKTFSGTSMAAPHVAGVAALLKAQDPGRDWRAIKNLILAGGDTIPSLAESVTQRRLDAYGSMTCSNSTVLSRLLPISDAFDGIVGTSLDLSAVHINCANPNGEVNVVVDPGGQIVTLRDNGIGPDLAAGDGIYSGQWTPSVAAEFTLNFPGGDAVAVRVRPGAPNLFRPYETHWVGSWPEAVAIGDVNGDGRNDVVMTTSYYFDPDNDFHIHVFLQQPWGELAPPVKYPTFGSYGNPPQSIAIGDVNHDGKADVVVGNCGDSIAVFLQNNSGGLDGPVLYATINSCSVKIADLNNDGLLDVVGLGGGTNTVGVLLQNGNGSLDAPVSYNVTHGGYDDLKVGDVNHDGLTDIVVMSGQLYQYPDIGVLLQNPDGTFGLAVYYDLGGDTPFKGGIGVGDVNGDGLDDIVMSYGGNQPSSFIGAFLQNSSHTLNPAINYPSYDIPESVEIADVNFDGRNDVIVLHGGWMAMGVYLQAPNGALFPEELYPIPYASHYNPQGLAVGDINGDGLNDVVIADYNHGLVALYHSPLSFLLAVNKTGSGSGTVTSSPPGINCGSDCSVEYDSGTEVALAAIPAADSLFVGWSGGGCTGTGTCTVTMNSDTSITATFNRRPYNLTASKIGTGSGTITSNPLGINCGVDCSEAYASGTSVTLTAIPDTGFVFGGWSGGGCSGTGTCIVTMNADTTVNATFVVTPLALGASSLPNGDVAVEYNTSLGVTGGFPPYTVAVTKGFLPPGLHFGSPSITGTPTVSGKKSFTIKVTDQVGSSASKRFTLQIYPQLKVVTLALAAGKVGRVYNKTLKAKGGPAPYSWSLLPGAPAWLTLSATGKITGTPTDAGTFNATFQVTDPLGGQAQKSFTLKIK